MDSKLEEYRLRKRRKERYEQFKGALRKMLSLGVGTAKEKESNDQIVDVPEYEDARVVSDKEPLLSDIPSTSEEDELSATNSKEVDAIVEGNKFLQYTLKTMYFLFWATLYVIAIELQFGIVFLMLSALLGIYFNTRTGPKRKHEISAYSVFNKDFESIDGTLKAEQFEREIRYGSNSVR